MVYPLTTACNRRFAAVVAVLTLVVCACTHPVAAGQEKPTLTAAQDTGTAERPRGEPRVARPRSRGDGAAPNVRPWRPLDRRGSYQEPAFARGYADGYMRGVDDSRDRDRYDPVGHRDYRNGDQGYYRDYGTRDAYRNNYRAGFRQGYSEGYRDGGGRR